jgi:hypothetical protein
LRAECHPTGVRSIAKANGWLRAFDDPIVLPDGKKLLTLRDVATYITELPKAGHSAEEWQTAK